MHPPKSIFRVLTLFDWGGGGEANKRPVWTFLGKKSISDSFLTNLFIYIGEFDFCFATHQAQEQSFSR